ncbi:Zn-finger nucleic acid-binding protein [Paenibacillus shirakamiensis]|uniref:Zn-finger nucleic acid-binding protein n=1 Tax=Paenibacillus shirakamiensis TaxID=1265935 RepID=A0ABS4JLT3_9BACL|nr:zf-TFIIB domain-containing protein [Paenibacillus shirakamiensis]MBP2002663.1 Zn-finger nucleic acid-binding protein [Paenibacillus shirakamiensis]
MNCPVCDKVQLREIEKNGVLIDVCPSCKGVWLDRGELDKLMTQVNEARPSYNAWYNEQQDHSNQDYSRNVEDNSRNSNSYSSGSNYARPKKKKSMMDVFGDLFD